MKNLTRRLDAHVAASTIVAAAAAVSGANAAVVAWENCNIVIPATIDGLYINVETRVTGSAGSVVAGWDINPYSATSLTWYNATGTGMMRHPGITTGSAGNLALGTIVGGAGVTNGGFATSFGSGAVTVGSLPGNWKLNSVNIFGFRFVAADGGTKYGYGTFQIGSSIFGSDRTITNIYFESSGGSITVVPAPGALALLGVAGLIGGRRRR
jgi:MYXO-CTERM domain-containing protein